MCLKSLILEFHNLICHAGVTRRGLSLLLIFIEKDCRGDGEWGCNASQLGKGDFSLLHLCLFLILGLFSFFFFFSFSCVQCQLACQCIALLWGISLLKQVCFPYKALQAPDWKGIPGFQAELSSGVGWQYSNQFLVPESWTSESRESLLDDVGYG